VLERECAPQISRLNPGEGFGRLFGKQGIVEFAKSLIKILVVSLVVALACAAIISPRSMRCSPNPDFAAPDDDRRHQQGAADHPVRGGASSPSIDFAWTRHHWFEELMMTKQEVKEEMKQTQGDPIIKQRMRSIQRDRARRRMMTAVPRATLVIANPTHFAVALRYVREEGDAPVIVAKGQDLVALKIREIAEENGIPVFEDPPSRTLNVCASLGR
jgi:flagellar biosynthetic protein FlhB